jgi:hypothetical protein
LIALNCFCFEGSKSPTPPRRRQLKKEHTIGAKPTPAQEQAVQEQLEKSSSSKPSTTTKPRKSSPFLWFISKEESTDLFDLNDITLINIHI